MIYKIIAGLERKLFFLDDAGWLLKDIYKQIKIAFNDNDKVVQYHASSSLQTLSLHLKNDLFYGDAGQIGSHDEQVPGIRIIR